MKRAPITFLQVVIVLLGIGAAFLLLLEPHLEGVNANATFWEVYWDPFIALVYLGSIPFFYALYQAFNVLGLAAQKKVYSMEAVQCLRTMKYCALAVIGFVIAEATVILLNHGNDDAVGAMAIGLLIIFASIVVATAAAMFEQLLQTAVEIKTENDLTV
jgi:hypothetical protein